MQNNEGAFCWREDCKECLSLTKAVQNTAEALSAVGDLYGANVRVGSANQLVCLKVSLTLVRL